MTEWSVLVEAVAPRRAARLDTDDLGPVDRFVDELVAHHGSVTFGPDSYSGRITVDAGSAEAAAQDASYFVQSAARVAGLPSWPIAVLEVTRDDVLEAELARPQVPALVGLTEAAAIVGVTKQRMGQLRRDDVDCPLPIAELASGPVFIEDAVARYAVMRSDGRSAKSATPSPPRDT